MIVEQKSVACCVSPVACACAPASAIRNAMNTLEYSPDLCINCGMCSAVCPHAVFAPDGTAAQLVRPESCMECGACQLNCPTGAIRVDSGVGCAAAMIYAALTGKKEPTCGPDPDCGPGCCGS